MRFTKEELTQNLENMTDEQLLSLVEDIKNGMVMGDIKQKYGVSPRLAIKKAKKLMKAQKN